jgi:formate hydrogenlyase transcriptional activator
MLAACGSRSASGANDISLLAYYFTQKFPRRMNKPVERISAETTSWLTNSDWPGNVRQLENLRRIAGLTRGAAVIVGSLKPVSGG